MEYKGIINIKKEDKKYYDKCLKNIENGHEDDFINVGFYNFENGFTMYVDLCSGSENYYLQYELIDNKNNAVADDVLDYFEAFLVEDYNYDIGYGDKYSIEFNIEK